MEQEIARRVLELERQSQELEQNFQFISNQISELEQFKEDIGLFSKSKEKEALASLGKGVYVKSSIKDKKELFVEVGSGIIVKKTSDETEKTIDKQIKRLYDTKIAIQRQLDSCILEIQKLMNNIK